MAFEICFGNKVNAILIAKLIPRELFDMAGDCVDIVLLHEADIPKHIILGNNSAACVPLVTVDALKTILLRSYT